MTIRWRARLAHVAATVERLWWKRSCVRSDSRRISITLALVASAFSQVALPEAQVGHLAAAQDATNEPRSDVVPATQGTLTVEGSFPSDFMKSSDGAIAFATYTTDGNHRALHILSGAHERIPVILDADEEPYAWNDSFVLTRVRNFFQVRDARSGALLRRKAFQRFYPPLAGQHRYWLDGNVLTVISEDQNHDSTLRRIRLPDLEVVESFSAPFGGSYVRWGDKFVGVGYWHGAQTYPLRPSIAVLDGTFRIVARSEIEDSRPLGNRVGACRLELFAEPFVMSNMLIYSADCGGIRVHDLQHMQPIAARGPVDSAISLSFGSANGRLLAFGIEDHAVTVDEIALPTLLPTRVLRVEGQHVIVSGPNVYAFLGDGSARDPTFDVRVLRIQDSAATVPSLSQSIVSAQVAAAARLRESGDVFAAIEVMRAAMPRVLPGDLAAVTPVARTRIAWYATLLVRTHTNWQDGLSLLGALHDLSPQDERYTRLREAADTSVKATLASPESGPSKLSPSSSTLTTGVLPGAIAQNDQYVVTGRWCGTDRGATDLVLEPSYSGPADAAEALRRCFAGVSGLAVHEANDLSFKGYVPITLSDDVSQENVQGVVISGHIAYASIATRYDDKNAPAVVAVDLRSGRITAKRSGDYGLRLASGKLLGCVPDTGCVELDPLNLEPKQEMQIDRAPANTVLAAGRSAALVETTGLHRGLAVATNADKRLQPVNLGPGIVVGSGLTSPDGRYAFIRYAGAGERLIRIDLETGRSLTLADGEFDAIGSADPMSPYFFDWNSGVLEVRDATSGRFVCGWPGLAHANAHVFRLMFHPQDHSLVLLATVSSRDDVNPSVIIPLDRLVALSRKCDRQTTAAETGLEEALRPLE